MRIFCLHCPLFLSIILDVFLGSPLPIQMKDITKPAKQKFEA